MDSLGVGVGPLVDVSAAVVALGAPDSDPGGLYTSLVVGGGGGALFSYTSDGTRRDGYNEGMRWDIPSLGVLAGLGAINADTTGFLVRCTLLAAADAGGNNPLVFFGAGATGTVHGGGWSITNAGAPSYYSIEDMTATFDGGVPPPAVGAFGGVAGTLYVCTGNATPGGPLAYVFFLDATGRASVIISGNEQLGNVVPGMIFVGNNNLVASAATVEVKLEVQTFDCTALAFGSLGRGNAPTIRFPE